MMEPTGRARSPPMLTSIMTPASRTEALAKMSDDEGLDILVIGGGVTGAGVASEAATRGLRVGIVEAQDWASGTSSRRRNWSTEGCATCRCSTSISSTSSTGARPADQPAGTAPGQARGLPRPLEHRVWSVPTWAGVAPLRHPRHGIRTPPRPALPPAPVAQGHAPSVPRPAPRRGRRRAAVLGRLGLTMPGRPDPGPDGRGDGALAASRTQLVEADQERRRRGGWRGCPGPRDRPRAPYPVPVR